MTFIMFFADVRQVLLVRAMIILVENLSLASEAQNPFIPG